MSVDNVEIIEEIKRLVQSKGYIYALAILLFEDFNVDVRELNVRNHQQILNVNEASLLLGFLIQNKIDLSIPESVEALLESKQKTRDLLEKLHKSIDDPINKKVTQQFLTGKIKQEKAELKFKEIFGTGDAMIEPIFYSGTGVYDFQYLEFLERKYKYDKDWLIKNRNFDFSETKKIFFEIKEILQIKSQKIPIISDEELIKIINDSGLEDQTDNWMEHIPKLKFSCYYSNLISPKRINEPEYWNSFYKSVLDLATFSKSDFKEEFNIDAFLNNFSITPQVKENSKFQNIGQYNRINSHPIVKVGQDRYFLPIPFLLAQAIYDSPFHWITEDKKYFNFSHTNNRGMAGEDIVHDIMMPLFGSSRIFRNISITHTISERRKGANNKTEIDVLCILGSKALCIQVKSKPLTSLSRQGDDYQLKKDFNAVVQDGYEKCIISRQEILERKARFIDSNKQEIKLSEEIDEVYLMCVSMENYPALFHQYKTLLKKQENDPYPIILTSFDLEIISKYLSDPYDFLYYIRQRISLMDHIIAEEEMSALAYHLTTKLYQPPQNQYILISQDFAKLIDRNYYPMNVGIDLPDDGDRIKSRWKNAKFDELCNCVKQASKAKVTDIIFYLLDWSGDVRDNLVNLIEHSKRKTVVDGKIHDFSLVGDGKLSGGVTYISLNSNNVDELNSELLTLCKIKKHNTKSKVWLGIGSLQGSDNVIDVVVYGNHEWQHNQDLADASNFLRGSVRKMTKVGRNDKCLCGSSLKYKNCCGS